MSDDFESWWQASKYCQVSHGAHRQVALDGWNAGTESLRQQLVDEKAHVKQLETGFDKLQLRVQELEKRIGECELGFDTGTQNKAGG